MKYAIQNHKREKCIQNIAKNHISMKGGVPKNSICSGTGSYLELHFEHEAFLRLDSRLWTYYMRRGGM